MAITIKDVAKAANVSVSTVSKVINGHYSISQETQEHVRKIMRDLNYVPSASAQSFAKGATQTVTVLTKLTPNIAFQNPHMFEIIAGLEEHLCAKGYKLVLRSVDEATVYEVAEDLIARRSTDALAIHVAVMTHPLSALLTRLHFPHIVLGAPNFESQVCWIDNNNVYSGTVAASYLLSRGYKKIAFLGGQYYDVGSNNRLQGLKEVLQDAKLPLEEQFIWLGDSTRDEGYRMTMKMLSQKELPDAIVCANNHIAVGCVAAVVEKGMKIPEDMAIMAFDDYPLSQFVEPKLTVVDINVRDLGVQAGKFLVQIIRRPNMQVQTYVTTSNLIVRGSTEKIDK